MTTRTEPWYWLNDSSRLFLQRGYLADDQTPEERIKVIADTAERLSGEEGFAKKFTDYMSRGWISLASPVWSNYGISKGLPISCFGSYVGDNMGSILYTQAEVGMMTKFGGGCSGYFGALRGRGATIAQNGQSSGSVHFMQLFETLVDVVSQGHIRRGHLSPYLPLEHPDVHEFLDIGTEGNPIQKLTHGVTVGDEWLKEMMEGDEEKRAIWAKVIQRRGEMGYPYIFYSDNVNNNTVDVYKDKGLRIHASNMCSEIMLPSKEDWSFVCCLSSVNLLHYDEWKDTDLIETMITFLDTVMEDFIQKLEDMREAGEAGDKEKKYAFEFMERAYNFAKANRALGLGVLGWHSLLQSKRIPLESEEANTINKEVFKTIRSKADSATKALAKTHGEPEILKGYGRRHTTLLSIAPTTSSAFILGQVSQSIEPVWSNCYTKDLQKMKTTIKNPFLIDLLEEKGKNTKEVWDSIRDNDGSVQYLDCLTEEEKAVFRTFAEIDQSILISQAADRQEYLDQGQSLNVMIAPDTPVKEINQLYIQAWKQGIKTLYYQHSMNAAQQLSRRKIAEATEREKEK